MAQTEMMLRLLKDGKIVGYKYTCVDWFHPKKGIVDWYYTSYSQIGNEASVDGITHDSFELGIKVGDDWWFEGDIVKSTQVHHPREGVIIYNHNSHKFGIDTGKSIEYPLSWLCYKREVDR